MAQPVHVSGRGQREHRQHIQWPVCKFDLILATLSALTNVPARHLPFFHE